MTVKSVWGIKAKKSRRGQPKKMWDNQVAKFCLLIETVTGVVQCNRKEFAASGPDSTQILNSER